MREERKKKVCCDRLRKKEEIELVSENASSELVSIFAY
jgi:hypothetical protein